MLTAFVNAFKTPDLRKKLLFTLFIVALFRVGSVLPTPGVDAAAVRRCLNPALSGGGNNIYGMLNLFSGGALLQLSVFALTIMPYITASIIIQLLTVVIPRLETLKKEGHSGTQKITQYTRYLTIGLAILQSTTIVALARSGRMFQGCNETIIPNDSILTLVTMVLTMTAGTGVIMWFGELITDRGVGNGMSVLIFVSIAAGFPTALWGIRQQKGWVTFLAVIAIGLVIMGAVIYVEQAQRRIPVQYAKRMLGRRAYGGSSTYIPLKVNQAGVIPVIFASSLLYVPVLAAQFNPNAPWAQWITTNISRGDHPAYMLGFFLLIVAFTYFYVGITFNPTEVADNMKKHGGFIPGIRAGKPTEDYLQYVLSRITAPGSLYLGVLALIPLIAFALIGANQNFPFGGTSILIVVGVGLDTVKQIESQLQQRHYEGFLR
ncbi:protein translocase subunit secY/sec61 alpha [Actinopolymorpha cephalotaxi]|uniref:Protein translocase subunit SecY n=1 Tax=Actinopolymorpha cephalotaxi TaxID=504797 RepID=A0A1I2V7G7_9ACTN|nr:preprotein translocase subunit SecY [Actinopolymorpha cephalotaxi]SFG84359.1 protein translocase subunit secY/sec61 alpha [Actinopolymorpha cephalotaxi]